MVDANRSSDEDDYMSEKYLNVEVKVEKLKSVKVKREIELDNRRRIANAKNSRQSRQHLEEVNRQKALNTKIDSNNKGFQTLLKMGYKEGQGLDDGIRDPIRVIVKKDRSGLGMSTTESTGTNANDDKTAILNSAQKRFQNTKQLVTTDVFIKKLKTTNLSRQLSRDICTAKKACRDLDEYKEVENPIFKYWPVEIEKRDCESSSISEPSQLSLTPEDEKYLDEILDYLRNTHYYCIYCGTSFNDVKDMNDDCPGKHRENH